jgi:multidrug resistance efflux pump
MVRWHRLLKGIVSVGLIGGSLGFYANGRFRLTASYAVVAAPANSIHAPADGLLSHSVKSFSVLDKGVPMASVAPTPTNDPALRAAIAELETVRADVASLKNLIALGDDMRSKTRDRQAVLANKRTSHLEHLLEKATADLATKQAAMEGAELARKRSVELCAQGLMGTQDCESVQTKAEVDKREFDSAAGQVGIAQFLLESSKNGADVGQDMGSEVTYARQQRDELTLRMASLRQQLETREAQAKALELRVNPPAVTAATSSRSRVWSVFRQSGVQVVKGEPLFEVVDCEQLFVFVTISEDRYEHLRIGMKAEVSVGDRVFQGKIAQLLGPYGTFSQERGMQPQPPVIVNGRDATSAAVAVHVPELSSIFGRGCEIGTRAEVEFSP